jgi:4-hydroxybenzoate polyprenyltransferase
VRVFGRTLAWVLTADRFVRLHLLFFTVLWLLLGAASVARNITGGRLTVLLAIALCFHVYAYVLNDVIDLPIDRTQPERQRDPLVRGAIRPSQALGIALVQPLLTVPLTMRLDGGAGAYATLAVGFALMGAYNLWGKRCPFPPLTDTIQGLAWGSLAIYAAQALGAAPNALTWMVAAYATVYILFINGIHGSFRDLGNDRARGARTTAIFFGAVPPSDRHGLRVPASMVAYASSILAVLVGTNAFLMFRNDLGYGRLSWTITSAVVGAINVGAVLLQPQVVRPRGAARDMAWRLQMYLLMISMPIAFVARASGAVLVVLMLLNAMSLALFKTTAVVTRWAWRTLGLASSIREEKNHAARAART